VANEKIRWLEGRETKNRQRGKNHDVLNIYVGEGKLAFLERGTASVNVFHVFFRSGYPIEVVQE
jgi:hypothetical protein